MAPDNFSAHEELAKLAERRDDLALAAEQYERAWRLKMDRRDLLIELGRAWNELGRKDDAMAAWIAAWRGGTPRVSEQARALLPARYPYLSEFQRALALDPGNLPLLRDVAFQQGQPVPASAPALQTPCLASQRATRPRRLPRTPRVSGLKSLEKGYMADALKYLELAHEADPRTTR